MSTPPHFDLVEAAERLLEEARQLAARTKPGEDDNDLALRRSIAATAKRIIVETAPRIDVVKADWIVASPAETQDTEPSLTHSPADLRGRSLEHLHRLEGLRPHPP